AVAEGSHGPGIVEERLSPREESSRVPRLSLPIENVGNIFSRRIHTGSGQRGSCSTIGSLLPPRRTATPCRITSLFAYRSGRRDEPRAPESRRTQRIRPRP